MSDDRPTFSGGADVVEGQASLDAALHAAYKAAKVLYPEGGVFKVKAIYLIGDNPIREYKVEIVKV